MARTLPKERFLPSLLDRLTDDDPINTSIRNQKEKIAGIEKSLAELSQGKMTTKTEESQKRQLELQQQLDELRVQFTVLTTSVSSLHEIRACVKRDLDWLLNASQYSPQQDLDGYPDVASSVLNYA